MIVPPCPKCWRRIKRPSGADPAGLCGPCLAGLPVKKVGRPRTAPRCLNCERERMLVARGLCTACFRTPGVREGYPMIRNCSPSTLRAEAEVSEAELERIVAEQMRDLPWWWAAESPPESRQTMTPGKIAEPVRITSRRVWRKGTR